MSRRHTTKGERKTTRSRADSAGARVHARGGASRAPSTAAQSRTKRSNRRRARSEDTMLTQVHGRLSGAWSKLSDLVRRHGRVSVFAVVGLGLSAVIVVALRQTRTQLEDSQMFRLETIEVKGNVRASTDEIEGLLGVEKGDNIIALDTNELERFVSQHPWVQKVEIRRGLPRKLVVEVQEHEPVALVALEHLYYADAEGRIVKRRSVEDRDVLPVVTGFSRAKVESADRATALGLRRAVGFPRLLRQTLGPSAPELDEIHHDEVVGLTFVPKDEDVRVHVGRSRWESQIKKFGAVRSALRERGLEAAEVTLGGERRPERVVVKLSRGRS